MKIIITSNRTKIKNDGEKNFGNGKKMSGEILKEL